MSSRPFKTLLAAFAAVCFIICSVPAFAVIAQDAHPTPAGYNDHDYQKLVTFLEYVDENGMTNGEKISRGYDPDDPATWSRVEMDGTLVGPTWTEDEEKQLSTFFYQAAYGDGYGYGYGYMRGDLDLSGCAALTSLECYENELYTINVSGCEKLRVLDCDDNPDAMLDVTGCHAIEFLDISHTNVHEIDLSAMPHLRHLSMAMLPIASLDLSNNPDLEEIYCEMNPLTEVNIAGHERLRTAWFALCDLTSLDLSGCSSLVGVNLEANGYAAGGGLRELDLTGCSSLRSINVTANRLSSLDLSGCPELCSLYCSGNELKELDFSNNPLIPFEKLRAVGDGFIGTETDEEGSIAATAAPAPGASFLGWYDGSGAQVSAYSYFYPYDDGCGEFTARFSGGAALPGDADGSGTVNALDALLVMRYSMGLASIEPAQLACCDVNGDGSVNAADALNIMRTVLGLA